MNLNELKAAAWDKVVQINQLQAQIQQLNQTLGMIQQDIQKAEADGQPKVS
jgi:hypothetical protein